MNKVSKIFISLFSFFLIDYAYGAEPTIQATVEFMRIRLNGRAFEGEKQLFGSHLIRYGRKVEDIQVIQNELTIVYWFGYTNDDKTFGNPPRKCIITADLSRLSPDVKVIRHEPPYDSGWRVSFECSSEECITITTYYEPRKFADAQRILDVYSIDDDYKRQIRTDVETPSTVQTLDPSAIGIPVQDEETAKRIAKALSHLITLGGGKKPPF